MSGTPMPGTGRGADPPNLGTGAEQSGVDPRGREHAGMAAGDDHGEPGAGAQRRAIP